MGSGTQTATTNSEPWGPTRPHLENIMGRAQTYHDQGIGTGIYGGPTQAPMDPNTSMALRGIQNTALNTNTSQPFNFGSYVLNNAGITQPMQTGIDTMRQVGTGQLGIGTGNAFQNVADRAATGNPVSSNVLTGVATGQAGITTSPEIQNLYGHVLNQNNARKGVLDQGAGGVLDNPMAFAYRDVSNRAATPTAAEGFDRSGMQGIANRNTGATFSERFLGDMAAGGNANEFATRQADINAQRIRDQINSSVSGRGRYGGFGHGAAIADRISEANNPMMMQAFEADQARRLAATGQMDASRATADNIGLAANRGVLDSTVAADATRNAANQTRLGAIGGEAGIYDANANRRLNSAVQGINAAQGDAALGGGLLNQLTGVQGQNIGNAMTSAGMLNDQRSRDLNTELAAITGRTGVEGQNITNTMQGARDLVNAGGQGLDRAATWAGMMPQLNDLQYDPSSRLGAVGEYLQGRNQTEIDANRQRFEQEQMMPWTSLNRYLGAVSGLSPLLSGLGTTTQTAPGPSLLGQLFGGGIAGIGALGKTNAFGPTGWMFGR